MIGNAGFEPVRQVAIDKDWSELVSADGMAELRRRAAGRHGMKLTRQRRQSLLQFID